MPGTRRVSVNLELETAAYNRGAAETATVTRRVKAEIGHLGTEADGTSRDMTQLAATTQVAKRQIDDLGDEARGAAADLTMLESKLATVGAVGTVSAAGGIFNRGGGRAGTFDFSQTGVELRYMAMAALVEIAAIAAPLVGAMVAGAVIGGVGVGGIVGGTVAAAKDPRVREAYRDLFAQMGRDIKDDASVLVDPLIDAADIFADKWRETSSRLEEFFRTLAPGIGPLAEGLMGFANEVLGGLQAAAEAAVPILEDMKVLLPELGKAVSDFFEMLADPDTGAREGFGDLITFTGGAVRGVGAIVSGLSESWNDFRDMPDWIKITSLAIPSIGFTAGTINFLKNATENYNAALIETKHVQGDLNPVFAVGIEQLDNMRQNFNRAQHAAVLFDRAIDASYSSFLDWMGAEINVEEALDDLQASFIKNGSTLDVHTTKGRENLSNLKEFAEASLEAAEAKYIETGSVVEADAVYDIYRQQLYNTFIALGKTNEQAKALTDQWLALQKLEDITKAINLHINLPGGFTVGPSKATYGGGLQEFDEGGMVKGPPGSRQLVWAHAGELVLTPQQQPYMGSGGAAGGSVNVSSGDVTVNVLLDGQAIEPRMIKVVTESNRDTMRRVQAGVPA